MSHQPSNSDQHTQQTATATTTTTTATTDLHDIAPKQTDKGAETAAVAKGLHNNEEQSNREMHPYSSQDASMQRATTAPPATSAVDPIVCSATMAPTIGPWHSMTTTTTTTTESSSSASSFDDTASLASTDSSPCPTSTAASLSVPDRLSLASGQRQQGEETWESLPSLHISQDDDLSLQQRGLDGSPFFFDDDDHVQERWIGIHSAGNYTQDSSMPMGQSEQHLSHNHMQHMQLQPSPQHATRSSTGSTLYAHDDIPSRNLSGLLEPVTPTTPNPVGPAPTSSTAASNHTVGTFSGIDATRALGFLQESLPSIHHRSASRSLSAGDFHTGSTSQLSQPTSPSSNPTTTGQDGTTNAMPLTDQMHGLSVTPHTATHLHHTMPYADSANNSGLRNERSGSTSSSVPGHILPSNQPFSGRLNNATRAAFESGSPSSSVSQGEEIGPSDARAPAIEEKSRRAFTFDGPSDPFQPDRTKGGRAEYAHRSISAFDEDLSELESSFADPFSQDDLMRTHSASMAESRQPREPESSGTTNLHESTPQSAPRQTDARMMAPIPSLHMPQTRPMNSRGSLPQHQQPHHLHLGMGSANQADHHHRLHRHSSDDVRRTYSAFPAFSTSLHARDHHTQPQQQRSLLDQQQTSRSARSSFSGDVGRTAGSAHHTRLAQPSAQRSHPPPPGMYAPGPHQQASQRTHIAYPQPPRSLSAADVRSGDMHSRRSSQSSTNTRSSFSVAPLAADENTSRMHFLENLISPAMAQSCNLVMDGDGYIGIHDILEKSGLDCTINDIQSSAMQSSRIQLSRSCMQIRLKPEFLPPNTQQHIHPALQMQQQHHHHHRQQQQLQQLQQLPHQQHATNLPAFSLPASHRGSTQADALHGRVASPPRHSQQPPFLYHPQGVARPLSASAALQHPRHTRPPPNQQHHHPAVDSRRSSLHQSLQGYMQPGTAQHPHLPQQPQHPNNFANNNFDRHRPLSGHAREDPLGIVRSATAVPSATSSTRAQHHFHPQQYQQQQHPRPPPHQQQHQHQHRYVPGQGPHDFLPRSSTSFEGPPSPTKNPHPMSPGFDPMLGSHIPRPNSAPVGVGMLDPLLDSKEQKKRDKLKYKKIQDWGKLVEEQDVPKEDVDLWYFMKLIRLHKYTPAFYGLSLDQVRALSDEELLNMNLTKGAIGRLRLELSLLPESMKTFPRRLRRDRYSKLRERQSVGSADDVAPPQTPTSS